MLLSKSPSFWTCLALHALWLHGLWEAVQCRLFYDMSGGSFARAFVMTGATGADVVLTLILVTFALRLARGHFGRVPLLLAVGGAIAAILIEILALTLGWWRYSPLMPSLQFSGQSIGLLPLVQMALLPSLAFLLSHSFSSKSI